MVTQSNKLVEARYNLPLSEQRLILTMIARIQPDDEDFKPYRISISEFAAFLGIDPNSMYRECKKITKKLLTRVVEINEPDGLLQTNWVSSAKYVDGTGMVDLSFDPLLRPYLLQLKSGFTSCKLEMLLSFKSQYSMRFYMFIKQYSTIGTRELTLIQLRETIGIADHQYRLYSNFRNRILIPCQKELQEKADLYFEFNEIKCGRRIEALHFKILNNNQSLLTQVNKELGIVEQAELTHDIINQLITLIPVEHRHKKAIQLNIKSFFHKSGAEFVKRNIHYSNAKADKSYAGFFNKALTEDWGHDWELDQQQVIKNKPKEVWERQGFSSETEYDQFMYQQQMASLGKT